MLSTTINDHTKYYKNTFKYFNEVSNEENEEIINELDKLTDDDLKIVRSEMIVL